LEQVGATTTTAIIISSIILTIIIFTFPLQLDQALTELLLSRKDGGDGGSDYQQQQQLQQRANADQSHSNAERLGGKHVYDGNSPNTSEGEIDDDHVVIELNR
jgi:hypothetical protein